MKLSKKKRDMFLRSQLVQLIAIDLVEHNVNINATARAALQDAKLMIGLALDKLISEHPAVEKQIDKMTALLSAPEETPSGQADQPST